MDNQIRISEFYKLLLRVVIYDYSELVRVVILRVVILRVVIGKPRVVILRVVIGKPRVVKTGPARVLTTLGHNYSEL